MLADLALTSVAVIEPLKKTILMNKFNASTAGARVPERIIVVPGVPTDPAHVTFVVVVQQIEPVLRIVRIIVVDD